MSRSAPSLPAKARYFTPANWSSAAAGLVRDIEYWIARAAIATVAVFPSLSNVIAKLLDRLVPAPPPHRPQESDDGRILESRADRRRRLPLHRASARDLRPPSAIDAPKHFVADSL